MRSYTQLGNVVDSLAYLNRLGQSGGRASAPLRIILDCDKVNISPNPVRQIGFAVCIRGYEGEDLITGRSTAIPIGRMSGGRGHGDARLESEGRYYARWVVEEGLQGVQSAYGVPDGR